MLALLALLALTPTQIEAVDAKVVADKWIAIAVSLDEGAPQPTLPAVDGARWQRFRSLSLKNLMPCYDVVIGGAFGAKKDALALVKKMRDAGINAYAKQSGKYVGEPPALLAHCARRNEAPGTCGALSFVEEHGKQRLFALVDAQVAGVSDALAQAGKATMLDGDKGAWLAPLPADTKLGVWSKGYALDVYDLVNAKKLDSACSVSRLVSLTRGEPHFGYMQSEDAPVGPGCGDAELFAELSCKAGSAPSDVRLALPSGHRPPRLFASAQWSGDEAARAALIAHVSAMPAARDARAKADSAAKERNQKLDVTLDARRFIATDGGKREVIVAKVTWATGDANVCSDDVIESVTAVVESKAPPASPTSPTSPPTSWATVMPAWSASAISDVRAVYDFEGDGKLELAERDLTTTTLRKSDGSEICQEVVPFCDCAC